MKIWFDMDGTIADLYGVENWLTKLRAEDASPYLDAAPLFNLQPFARKLNTLQRQGYTIGIISWTSKGGTSSYNEAVANAKREWLHIHLNSVHFDSIVITEYGNPKENFLESSEDILFDDEERNRKNWTGTAYNVYNIMEVLRSL